jgi:hypothetical protein
MFAHLTTKLHIVEYDTLGRQYSISTFMKQDNITEMHIYVKYEIVSFMRRQFSSLKVIYKLAKIEKTNKQTKNKSRDLHKDCVCVSFWW